MNATYILVVCVGILWGGDCEVVRKFEYQTMAACQVDEKKVNARIKDGYAKCEEAPNKKKENKNDK
jgi:hypothetical protein